jgi:hypothetical protein
LSAVAESQATQVPPFLPHAPMIGETHAPLEQHPFGQDSALHKQAPPLHAVPAPQTAPVPQRQVPVMGSHPSAAVESQAVQAPPPVPQVAAAGTTHVAPLQQPFGQDTGLHVQLPIRQLVPAPQEAARPQRHSPEVEQLSAREGSHVTQAAPPLPQAAADPVVQVEPEQQPLPQLVAVQSAQAPPEQTRPAQS